MKSPNLVQVAAPTRALPTLVQVPVRSAENAQWWPDLFLKKGRRLQAVTPNQVSELVAVMRQRIMDEGNGASAYTPVELYTIEGEKIGYVGWNGSVWLHDIEGDVEVPLEAGKPAAPVTDANAPRIVITSFSERNSQETPCFTAKVHFQGNVYDVRNQGQGGGNDHDIPDDVHVKLDEWAAKTFPPVTECGGCKLREPLTVNFEMATFTAAFNF